VRNTTLNLLHEAGLEPTLENIQDLNFLGTPPELDGEGLAELEELFEECLEVAELEAMVQPSGTTWELAMVVTEKDREAARKRNARYAKHRK
jgi:hypothetical protein